MAIAAGLALAFGTVAATALPAAASTTSALKPTSTSYIDSTQPGTTFTPASNDELPVGAFPGAAGNVHEAKAYYTFSIASLAKHKVTAAGLAVPEVTVADCTTTRDTQLWLTASDTKPTWNKQPAEQLDLGTAAPQSACPAVSPAPDWNIAAALNTAIQAGRSTVTFELRTPDNEQSDPRFLRYYDPGATLTVTDESAPDAPATLQVDFSDCTSTPISVWRIQALLIVTPQSATEPQQDLTIDYWPVKKTSQVTDRVIPAVTSGDPIYDNLDTNTLTDGTTYAWHARGTVDGLVGPWSKTCEFTAEFTPPANPPSVSSTDYPSPGAPDGNGGGGIPGTFTFKPNGDADVASYWYGLNGNTDTYHVAASRIGGPASINFAPPAVGPTTLTVVAKDAAGNIGPVATYAFNIKDDSPVISCDSTAYVNAPVHCTFSPRNTVPSAIVGYSYSLGNGFTDVSVPPNGTATVDVTPTQVGQQQLYVDADLANGNTVTSTYPLNVLESAPTVTGPTGPVSINSQVSFTLKAVLPGSVTFTYGWSGGTQSTVPVGPDGTATVTEMTGSVPLRQPGFQATSSTADGVVSDPGYAYVDTVSDVPIVTSNIYGDQTTAGELGLAGTFTFTSAAPGVASYHYAFDGAAPMTVPAGADGTAQVSLTPETTQNDLVVSASYSDGHSSAGSDFEFFANSYVPQAHCLAEPAAGQPLTCDIDTTQPNAMSLTYTFDGSAPVTVPVGIFGTTEITLTEPDHPTVLSMTTTDNLGVVSSVGTYQVNGAPAS